MTFKRDQRRVISWDSCIFFAWIKQETCWPDDVLQGIEQTIESAYKNQLVLITSVVSITEVLQSKMTPEQRERYKKIFSHPNIQAVDIDRRIAEKAAVIREFHDTRKFDAAGTKVSGSLITLGDAIHLATAIHYDVTEFQTLDGAGKHKRKTDLLSLSGNVAGSNLKIVQPKFIPPPAPLEGPLPPDLSGPQQLLELVEAQEVSPSEESAAPIPASTQVPGGLTGSPTSEAGAKAAEAGKPEDSRDGQVASATVSKEEVASTESKTPASVKPPGDAKSGS